MKICILGNSHIAAFRGGWSKVADFYPDVELEFFGAKGMDLKALRARGSVLTANSPKVVKQLMITSGGKSSIDPKDYDGFLIVGVGAGVSMLIKNTQYYRTAEMIGDVEVEHLVSDDIFSISALNYIESSVFLRLIRLIRQVVPHRPIVVASTPFPRAGITKAEPDPWAVADLVGRRLNELWIEGKEQIAAEYDVEFVEQPIETIENRFFTSDELSSGSVRLLRDAEHEEEEFSHMNVDYGVAYLHLVMPRLSELVRSAKQPSASPA
ncbi:MAG: hypothetical protein DI565_06855 [Ancylobacter novellus]|uniref:SGNH/GDSL hydrolase family protein n=1 Tax=Ancylobacter novellus TaxID=921 RepID=A0A2W5KQG4_ANCNO|nr:MAG: hypothetical protein DI565_06855 [Ancylobacter novellus]